MKITALPRPRLSLHRGHRRNDGLEARLDRAKGHAMRHAPPPIPSGLR
jgi:hypothetical protein